VEGLVKNFDEVNALDGVSFELQPGELLAVVGPSGCGKSTLLRTVAGLVQATSGTVTLAGRPVDDGRTHLPPERRGVGLVFQDHALFPHLTVRQNVAFGMRTEAGRPASGRDTEDRVTEMLGLVSLADHGSRYPHELSGGERQRVALARALAPRPALMLFDEPFASIDQNLRVRLRVDVVGALRATGTPALFVTHDQAEALAIGDRIAVMRGGRIVQIGEPADVFHRPTDRFVGGFMGHASFLPIESDANGLRTALGPVDSEPGPATMAMVRPDDLTFTADEDGTATVVDAEYRGSDWLLTVALADGSDVAVTASHLDWPRPGTPGRVALVPGHKQFPLADRPGRETESFGGHGRST
jgi:iron(III) transport system ATP-binding protein